MVDTETGEFTERTLSHEGSVVGEFYVAGVVVIEANGSMQWFLESWESSVGWVIPRRTGAAETRSRSY